MLRSAVVAVDAAPFAERVGTWLPDLAGAGLRKATLYHAMEVDGPEGAAELDDLRPWLDHLAVKFSAESVEVEIALKRGDRLRWLLSLLQVRNADVVVVGPRCSRVPGLGTVGTLLAPLLDECPVPVLIVPRPRRSEDLALFSHPLVTDDPELIGAARALLPGATLSRSAHPLAHRAPASLLVARAGSPATPLEQALETAAWPVLAFPARALGAAPVSSQ
jgi:hypothetical protein